MLPKLLRHPTLRHPRLCRILPYVIVLGGAFLPCIIPASVEAIPGWVTGITLLIGGIAAIGFMVRNFHVLFALDMMLATLSCFRTAAEEYPLPKSFTPEQLTKRLRFYGSKETPTALRPQPDLLRYRVKTPLTVYTGGIEMVAAVYRTGRLTKEEYRLIFSSGKTNSKALQGKKRTLYLDRFQKKGKLNRATVIFILADTVDEALRKQLFKTVCKQVGDGFDTSYLPCVIDLERRVCTFDSLRMPFMGFGYPVKNRGIRLIRRIVFSGFLPYKKSEKRLDYVKNNPDDIEVSADMTLWELWHTVHQELKNI